VLIATTLWWVTPELVGALDSRLGPPVDSYLNGSQTWFTSEEPILELRLHPVEGFAQPRGLSHYDLWERVVDELHAGRDPEALVLGDETRALATLWDGLECFPAYGDDLEPATITRRAIELLDRAPDLAGLVDHEKVGDEWERTRGGVSIARLLATQLEDRRPRETPN
jgi:hypothetical protein